MQTHGDVKIRPVILAGGFGKRLWPVSSDNCPKQFAKLVNDESLFTLTLNRIKDRTRYGAPFIIGNIEHVFFITATLERLGIQDATILLEPSNRNTAAAALMTALHEKDEGMLHLLMPADHNIKDEAVFHESVAKAQATARDNLVLFGIRPKYPASGYGYIIPGKPIHSGGLQEISVFTEKPNETFARVLINQGGLWNSGIFLYDPQVLRTEAHVLAQKHYDLCVTAYRNAAHDRKCITFREHEYALLESHSLDTLIIEKTVRGAVLACPMEWSDVGSWYSLWHQAEKDEHGNAVVGSVVMDSVTNSYIHSEGVPVAAIDVHDCIIIAANDKVLVAPCSHAQEMRELYENHLLNNSDAHSTRPWGTYKNIGRGKNFLVKQITIWPGCSISLQTHSHRAEHWVVVSGKASAICEGEEKIVQENESVFIPKGAKHRLSNIGNTDLHIIEVQTGSYIGEDDITRYEDSYGRV